MQGPRPTEDDEASIPTEHVRKGPRWSVAGTFTVRRKASKHTLPCDLAPRELNRVSPPPQDEDIQQMKRPRLEKPFPTITDEATAKLFSRDTEESLPAAADAAHADADLVKGARSTGRWTPEEDAKLNSAVTNICKKKYGKEYKTDWVAIAALVPGRARNQCCSRWHDALDPSIVRTPRYTSKCALDPSINRVVRRSVKWTTNEDAKLKDAVKMHGKNWPEIATLVPGRTKLQCCSRWHGTLDPSIDWTMVRAGYWTSDEDNKLKDAVQTHGGKDWAGIATLVPGRTNIQCRGRWLSALDPSIGRTPGRTGIWTTDEDVKLKDAVKMHNGKNWPEIAALVPGRTKVQCCTRWYGTLDPSIDPTSVRMGRWTTDEDTKLKDAVQMHNGKNWDAIEVLVPDPTKRKWGKNWDTIAALVPGRTKKQCSSRWMKYLDPNRSTFREGEHEDTLNKVLPALGQGRTFS
jgi:hypothetical protein